MSCCGGCKTKRGPDPLFWGVVALLVGGLISILWTPALTYIGL